MRLTILALLAAIVDCSIVTVHAQTWSQTSAPTTNWQSIASSADGTKLIAAAGGFLSFSPIYLSTNSGASWLPSSAPTTNWLRVASSADGSKLVAAGYRSIFYSTNSGVSWMQASAPNPFEYWSSVASSADGTQLAAGEIGGSFPRPMKIYLSTNSGAAWYPAGVNGSAVALSADGVKMVALENNASTAFINLSTSAGKTWKSNYTASAHQWWAVASSADGTKLAVASGGSFINSVGPIYTSTNSGATWRTNNTAPSIKWSSIASSADGTKLVAAAAANGSIYTSIDSGASWVSNNTPVTNWSSVAISADGAKLVAAVNGGGIWTAQATQSPRICITPISGSLALSWIIPSADFVLQQNSALTTPNWVEMTNLPVFNFTNLQKQITLPISASNTFYRLKTP